MASIWVIERRKRGAKTWRVVESVTFPFTHLRQDSAVMNAMQLPSCGPRWNGYEYRAVEYVRKES